MTRMIHPDTFKNVGFSGSKGLVFIGDKLLVYRRDTNTKSYPLFLDMPGGGKEGGESPFETFKREVMEEFSIEISENDIAHSYAHPSFADKNVSSFFFITKPLRVSSDDIRLGDEGIEWMLMSPTEFIQRSDAIDRHQERVRTYLAGKPIIE